MLKNILSLLDSINDHTSEDPAILSMTEAIREELDNLQPLIQVHSDLNTYRRWWSEALAERDEARLKLAAIATLDKTILRLEAEKAALDP